MSSGALIAVIVGAVLVISGLAWAFLAALGVIKAAERRLRPAAAEEAGWPDVVRDFIAWLKDSLPKKLVPGFALVLAGSAIIIVALVTTSP